MKMKMVIELFFRSRNSGNCVLDHIILCSDECLVLVPDDNSRKVSSSFLTLVCKLQHQANQPEAQMLLFSCWPGWPYRGICAAPPKAELVLVIHPIAPGFDGLGSPCSAVVAWPEQALWTSLVHLLCTALPVTGLLYSLTASLLWLSGEQSLPERPYSSDGTGSK